MHACIKELFVVNGSTLTESNYMYLYNWVEKSCHHFCHFQGGHIQAWA